MLEALYGEAGGAAKAVAPWAGVALGLDADQLDHAYV